MKKILSIDGGGIRGLIPALIIAEIERQTGKKCADMFDMIAGTSTGGILALAYNVKDKDGKLKYTSNDLAAIYKFRGKEIFNRTFREKLLNIGGIAKNKYSEKGLEKILQEYLGDSLLKDAKTNVLVTSYDIQQRTPYILKSWKEECKDVPMSIAGRATSAAPTYFSPIQTNIHGVVRTFVDGGMCANNPTMSAYAEAKRIYGDEELFILSLGTGQQIRPIPYTKAKNWGLAEWALPVLDCLFSGTCDVVDYQCDQILDGSFIRLQTDLSIASDDMDDTSEENILALEQEVAKILEKNSQEIQNIVNVLK